MPFIYPKYCHYKIIETFLYIARPAKKDFITPHYIAVIQLSFQSSICETAYIISYCKKYSPFIIYS